VLRLGLLSGSLAAVPSFVPARHPPGSADSRPGVEPSHRLAVGSTGCCESSYVAFDLAEAREWFEVLPAVMGVEGLVLKPTAARYAAAAGPAGRK
jgi:hypothetical protein